MFIKALKMQMSEMVRKKTVMFSFLVVFIFTIVNFWTNMFDFKEIKYVSQMYDIVKTLTLSEWSISGHFMMEYYPLLVVIPTACAYLTDKETRVKVYIESRVGKKIYWYSKLASVFIVTFLIFTIPFLIELAMGAMCFNIDAMGDPSGFSYIQTVEWDNQYLFWELWAGNRFLYAIVMILLFGTVSGILAMFNFPFPQCRFLNIRFLHFFQYMF